MKSGEIRFRFLVNFANTVAIIITCPFMFGMANSFVFSNNMVVSLPLIRIADGLSLSKLMNMRFQGTTISMMNHAQAHLPTLPSYCSNNRRPIIIIDSVSTLLVSAYSRRVFWIRIAPLHPPHSETDEMFQNAGQGALSSVVRFLRWLTTCGAWSTLFCNSVPVRLPIPLLSHLCKYLASVAQLAWVSIDLLQILYLYINCRPHHNCYNDIHPSHCWLYA